jgi:hypothetical protein
VARRGECRLDACSMEAPLSNWYGRCGDADVEIKVLVR